MSAGIPAAILAIVVLIAFFRLNPFIVLFTTSLALALAAEAREMAKSADMT
ncbi:hypothetical protein [Asaia bogorensis]|uniref:hypothetical protein n=1 Tax=Asaia bogorensis TaxID=91915 RepID=UPI001F094AEF|nr:hypothetical protein [Asaia bogorensis]